MTTGNPRKPEEREWIECSVENAPGQSVFAEVYADSLLEAVRFLELWVSMPVETKLIRNQRILYEGVDY